MTMARRGWGGLAQVQRRLSPLPLHPGRGIDPRDQAKYILAARKAL
ncbi:MAG: hypothetical protein HGA66_15995 [Holophaga sp.]|nr:hypothetical protein [Holophaga sp.]